MSTQHSKIGKYQKAVKFNKKLVRKKNDNRILFLIILPSMTFVHIVLNV